MALVVMARKAYGRAQATDYPNLAGKRKTVASGQVLVASFFAQWALKLHAEARVITVSGEFL
jgi:hypothetical protein